MKISIISCLLLLCANSIIACCAGDMVVVYPKNETISQNSIFLIEYSERDYQLFDELKKAKFYLKDQNGKKIKLEIFDWNIAYKNSAQVLLKTKHKLKKRSSSKSNGQKIKNNQQKDQKIPRIYQCK